MFPHVQTDHWSKMKTMVPVYLASVPAALLKNREGDRNRTPNSSLLPPLPLDETAVKDPRSSMVQAYSVHQNTPKNMSRFQNEFNQEGLLLLVP